MLSCFAMIICRSIDSSGIYARKGVDLDRATLADWVGKTAALVSPLVEAVAQHVMAAEKLHADDTPVPVLAPGTGKTKTGRLWVYLRDERPYRGEAPPALVYRYSPDRKGEHPRAHLAKFRGFLQADGYSGFGPLYDTATGVSATVTELACRRMCAGSSTTFMSRPTRRSRVMR
jgi:transposase